MTRIWIVSAVLTTALIVACGPSAQTEAPAPPAEPRTLTVMTHDSFEVSQEVLAAFEEEHNASVQFFKAGDTGTALNQAILSRETPLADVFYGVDNTFLSRALEEDIFERYDSPLLSQIPDEFKLDPENRALPVDYGDVCLNYDRSYFDQRGLTPPARLEDLTEPEYANLTVVQNPATSSPGLAFLLATIGHFGEEGYDDYWDSLQQNGVLVVSDWETAYYGEFTLHGGERPIVVSYGSSPPAEVFFADPPIDQHRRRDGRWELLPADRVCRRPPRHPGAGVGQSLDRFHALAHVSGGHAAQYVRLPRQSECRPARSLRGAFGDPGADFPGRAGSDRS